MPCILGICILAMAFSAYAFSHYYFQLVHGHTAILTMHNLRMPLSHCHLCYIFFCSLHLHCFAVLQLAKKYKEVMVEQHDLRTSSGTKKISRQKRITSWCYLLPYYYRSPLNSHVFFRCVPLWYHWYGTIPAIIIFIFVIS